ncbi:MAG TPA: glycoside hydrolase family 2 protein [Acetobacteraceae bacterium]|nr:glycoside hydrolase family 2 protein [Acetobacteraceae bacterium]
MARIRSSTASLIRPLSEAWECAATPANTAVSPHELPSLDWIAAPVPGTYALALRNAGRWDGESPLELDHLDIWYRTQFTSDREDILHFAGLATIAEIWLNGDPLLRSDNMFVARRIAVRTATTNELHICFRSLAHWLASQRGRAHWRPRLVSPSNLRFARTTLLGHMPGWCPTIHPVGPWRPVLRETRGVGVGMAEVDVRTAVFDSEGRVAIRAVFDLPAEVEAVAELGSYSERLQRRTPNVVEGTVRVPDADLWWPHTHGEPVLFPLTLHVNDTDYELGPVGFRSIEAQRGEDGNGFAIGVNGEAVFCRGACWTNAEIVALPCDDAAYRPWLTAMRDAGMNMVRICGTMVYEADAFYALCDELGLLVWQDAMLANFDYPAGEAFRASLGSEVAQFLDRTQCNPSLAVFCGGSEVLQQAAMLRLPADKVDDSLYTGLIPDMVKRLRPDMVYVTNSPSGGSQPFHPNGGVAHYYGVGAYLRPLDDARRAGVRFASECLALANVADVSTTQQLKVVTNTDPRWKCAVPRDPGAGWDFDDVRDHYLASLFGIDAAQLRWSDFARYLELSRAVSCLLVEHVFAEWRRAGSMCGGGLVWQLQDLAPGAGWGVIDSNGYPKPVWYALRRAFRSRQIFLTDEGLNGLHIHVLNETPRPLHAIVRLVCLKDGVRAVRQAEREITLLSRGTMRLESAVLLPEFFDITYAYRFGPRSHDVTVATLHDAEDNALIAEAVHFPGGPNLPPRDPGIDAKLEHVGDVWHMSITAQGFAQYVHIDDPSFLAEDNWFHLRPGSERRIALRPRGNETAIPNGEVRTLNMDRGVRYTGRR